MRSTRQPLHGTASEYRRGCRCPECRRAWARYDTLRRRRRGVPARHNYLASVRGRTHGIRTTYVKGCRCPECREAERLYKADLRRRKAAA